MISDLKIKLLHPLEVSSLGSYLNKIYTCQTKVTYDQQ